MVALWLPDDRLMSGSIFVHVFEVFCESGDRWLSDRGALHFARVLQGFESFCAFWCVSCVFYEVLARCLFEDGLRVRCAIFDVRCAISAMPASLKMRTFRAKVIFLDEDVNSVPYVFDLGRRLQGRWMNCQSTTLIFARVFFVFTHNCICWRFVKVAR